MKTHAFRLRIFFSIRLEAEIWKAIDQITSDLFYHIDQMQEKATEGRFRRRHLIRC